MAQIPYPIVHFAQFLFGLSLFYGTLRLFKSFEEQLSPELKIQIWFWLGGLTPNIEGTVQSWPNTVAALFDRIFGKKHLSWVCFWRSCLVSYSVLAVMICIALLVNVGEQHQYFGNSPQFGNIRNTLYIVIILALATNAIPDYLSLLVTRFLLNTMRGTTMRIAWLALLLVHFVGIIVLSFFLSHTLLSLCFLALGRGYYVLPAGSLIYTTPPSRHIPSFGEVIGALSTLHTIDSSWNLLYVYPALVTSVWLWLFLVSGLLLKAARFFDSGFLRLKRCLDIEHQPLQAIGLVAGVILAFGYWSYAAL